MALSQQRCSLAMYVKSYYPSIKKADTDNCVRLFLLLSLFYTALTVDKRKIPLDEYSDGLIGPILYYRDVLTKASVPIEVRLGF